LQPACSPQLGKCLLEDFFSSTTGFWLVSD